MTRVGDRSRLECQNAAMATVSASVVVATYNRSRCLERLLGALESQTGVDDFEIVVVDDGSTDDTWRELERLRPVARRPMVTLQLPQNRGPATARNVGWRAGTGPVVAFTDDDCLPDAGWLARLVARFDEADVVQGRTVPDTGAEGDAGLFSHTVAVDGPSGFYETCNIAYRRTLLEGLGGFDERFRHPYGEDVDLGWRAVGAGGRVEFEPEAVVVHEVRPSTLKNQLRGARRLVAVPLVLRLHPSLRPRLIHHLFYRSYHPEVLATVVGAVLVLRRPGAFGRWVFATAALAAYVRGRDVPGPLRHRVTSLPLVLLADLTDIGALAIGSVRHGALVL
ncbi:MAG: glycosyl transferase family 2 [Acidimicrobiales bacterium]|nr:glycosyl transferase family 2 [Acidimicrobiales bacterium]